MGKFLKLATTKPVVFLIQKFSNFKSKLIWKMLKVFRAKQSGFRSHSRKSFRRLVRESSVEA